MGRKSSKVSQLSPALAEGLTPQPGHHPHDIHRRGSEELLEVRERQANISTLAEIKTPDPLGEATLDPRPQRILRFELRRLLALPRGLDGLMVGLRPDRELPWGVFRPGACLAGWTGATG